jgi:hypothetical protein
MLISLRQITPSSSISWTPCFDQYTCAKLEVPIDYNDPSGGTTSLAFIKLAAEKDPDTAPNLVINNGLYLSRSSLVWSES